MLSRLLLATGLLVVLFAVGLPAYVWLHLDDPPFDDSHLRVERVVLSPEQDGIGQLTALAEQAPRVDGTSSGAGLTDEDWNEERVASFLNRHAEALEGVDQVLGAPVFQMPPLDHEDDAWIESALGWTRIAQALGVRAVWHARAGRPGAARADAGRAIALGERVQGSTGATMVSWIVGRSMMGHGQNALRTSLRHIEIDLEAMREWDRALPEPTASGEAWRGMWAGEYEWQRKVILEMAAESDPGGFFGPDASTAQGLMPIAYLFKPNDTLRLFGQRTERAMQTAESPCSDLERDDVDWDSAEKLNTVLGPNSIGEILVRISASDSIQQQRCAADAERAATRTMIALRAFEMAHGRLPGQLDELVPGFLASVPVDRFDGAPLRYDSKRRLLWSVGSNLEDESGAVSPDQQPNDEPRWPLTWGAPASAAVPASGAQRRAQRAEGERSPTN